MKPALFRRFAVHLAFAAAVCIAGVFGLLRWRESRFFETSLLLSRFPVEDAGVLRIDVAGLRAGGFLNAARLPLEAEYRQFLNGTGFDYRRDLDTVVASFSGTGNFFIAKGHFDWNKLRSYAISRGGSCYQQLCRVQGSAPERHISFLPLRDDALALAVSTDDLAASKLTGTGQPVTKLLPASPVWLSIPGSLLRQQGALPPGIRVVFSGLVNADRVLISLNPGPGGVEAHLEASCRTVDDARVLASQLRAVTGRLKEALVKDVQSPKDEFASMLMAGSFDQVDKRVTGSWPVRKALIESLTSGI